MGIGYWLKQSEVYNPKEELVSIKVQICHLEEQKTLEWKIVID